MLVAHIQAIIFTDFRHQRAEDYRAAPISRPDHVAFVVIIKNGRGVDISVTRIAHGNEAAVVIIDSISNSLAASVYRANTSSRLPAQRRHAPGYRASAPTSVV